MYSALVLAEEPVPLALFVGPELLISSVHCCIPAGFPSPAEDHAVKRLDMNDILIKSPASTFLMRVRGDSMIEAGISDGDLVLVDRSIRPTSGHVVVAVVDGEFTVKTLWKRADRVRLKAANPTYPDIIPRDGQTLEVWGVVTFSIRATRS